MASTLPAAPPWPVGVAAVARRILTSFADADEEPDPIVLDSNWSWPETRRFFETTVTGLARRQLTAEG